MSIASQLLKKMFQLGLFQIKIINTVTSVLCVNLCFFCFFNFFFLQKKCHVSGLWCGSVNVTWQWNDTCQCHC